MLVCGFLMLAVSTARVVQEGAAEVDAADGLLPQGSGPLQRQFDHMSRPLDQFAYAVNTHPREQFEVILGGGGSRPVARAPPARAPPVQAAAAEVKPAKPGKHFLTKGSQFPASKTPVRDHMTPVANVMALTSTQPLKEAAILMNDWGFTGAPVVDGGALVGVLSRKDLMRRISEQSAEDGDPAKKLAEIERQPVGEIMSATPVTISPDATLLEASQAMSKQGFNRLMVSEPSGELVGIITSADVIRAALCDEFSEIDYDAE